MAKRSGNDMGIAVKAIIGSLIITVSTIVIVGILSLAGYYIDKFFGAVWVYVFIAMLLFICFAIVFYITETRYKYETEKFKQEIETLRAKKSKRM